MPMFRSILALVKSATFRSRVAARNVFCEGEQTLPEALALMIGRDGDAER